MDDLYNNAWGDSSQFYASNDKPTTSTWASPSLNTTAHTEEADLAAPSWSTGADIRWNEPSEHESGFSWSGTDPDLVWEPPNTFADIQLGKSGHPAEEIDVRDDESPPSGPDDEDDGSPPSSPARHDTPDDKSVETLPSPSPSPPPDPRSPSPDIDGFGTFATALDTDGVEHSASIPREIEGDAWGSPWAGAVEDEEREEKPKVDEWELARRQKEKLDRKVPPEVLANILSQCEEYSREIHPAAKEEVINEKDAWMNEWRSGMESVEGLEALMQSIVPDLSLQPPIQFTKTSIAKQMASTVRITKALPMAKASPLSLYLGAKGSTAWEAAVKQQKLVVEEDVVPVGWRIVEKGPVETTDTDSSGSKQGGFFSFWGRRSSKPVTPILESSKEASPSRNSMPSRPSSSVGEVAPRASSSRASQDSTRSQPLPKETDVPMNVPKAAEPVQTPPETRPISTPPFASYSNAMEPQVGVDAQPQPAPSAVSRFLTRFSRSRSSVGSTSSRRSLALSSDDLEFLSDIVPSANDGHENDEESQRKALSEILKPEPLPPALPPPPLAPPPRPTIVTANKISTTPSISPTTPAGTPQSAIGSLLQADEGDDFGAFEDSPASSPIATAPQSVMPAIPLHFGTAQASSWTASPSPLSVTSLAPPPGSIAFNGFGQQTPSHSSSRASLPAPPQAPLTQRSATEPSEPSSRLSMPLRPKVPLSFTLPPPSATPSHLSEAHSPFSPTSDVPLGQLYPSAAQKLPSSIPRSMSLSRKPPSLNLPPHPSRAHTPIMVKAPLNSATQAPLLAPPPSTSGRSATPQLDLFNDEDDFADFQSSEPTPAPVIPQQSRFGIPPPPLSGIATSAALAPTPLLQPPPSSFASPMMGSPLSPDPSSSLISDFSSAALLASPSSALSAPSRKNGQGSSPPAKKHLLTLQTPVPSSDFDDFMGFGASSALRTPSPPRPPTKVSKAPKIPLSISPPKPSVDHSTSSILSTEEKKSQHLRTMSLLERAAARPGQWPAPPSPLPQAISFPILGAAPKAQGLMGDDDGFGTFESDTMNSEATQAPSAAPSFFPPPPAVAAPKPPVAAPSPAPMAWGDFTPLPSSNGAARSLSPPSQTAGAGGLSAQDLSFFEGL